MDRLWSEASAIRTSHYDTRPFEHFVGADYRQVLDALQKYRGQGLRMLEWGSGLGVVTIMANRMGFEAYGIEIEPELVEHAEKLAEIYAPDAQFFVGSFVPDEFELMPEEGDEFEHTDTDSPSVYDELDLEVRDFDLVYAYPWPDEHSLHHNIMKRFGGDQTLLLTFDECEGIQEHRFG